MNSPKNTKPARLLPDHREHLRKSGLTDETIAATAIFSVTDPVQAAGLLKWQGKSGPAPAIAFPNFGLGGEVLCTILRPDTPCTRQDGNAPKYETPIGSDPRLYFPPPLITSPDAWTDSSEPLMLLEGIKKALAAAQVGAAAISAQGVTVWHDIAFKKVTGQYRLHPDFTGLPLSGRLIFVAFDGGDTTDNPHVILAEARLARLLLDAGARVRLIRIPFRNGGPKVGLDDFLVTQRNPGAALLRLQEEALEADPLVRARAAKASKDPAIAISELLKDRSFAASLHIAGPASVDIVAPELKPVRRSAVDETVERFRGALGSALAPSGSDSGKERQGKALVFADPTPWHEPVDGEDLLDGVLAKLKRHVAFPAEASAVAVALWVAFTYVVSVVSAAPILALLSPQKRCGKTTLLRLLSSLVLRPLSTSNITPAALFRTIETTGPTLLIDEADTFLRENDDMRGLLNAGHTKETAFVIRTVGEDFEPRRFNVFCAKGIAAIGKLHGTLEDRSVIIRMRRRAKGETVERIPRALASEVESIRRKLFRWAQDHRDELLKADPMISEKLNDREADNWRPLIAIADIAGGRWPDAARSAALELCAAGDDDAESVSILLLRDLRDLFDGQQAERMPTKDILDHLKELEERPWRTWKEIGLNAQALRSLLQPFGITSDRWAPPGSKEVRGYLAAVFKDAWTRYLDAEGPSNPPDPPQARDDSGFRQNGSAAEPEAPADAEVQIPLWNQPPGGSGGSADVEEGEL